MSTPNPLQEATSSSAMVALFVVDDDPAFQHSIRRLASSVGLLSESFASAGEFLHALPPAHGGCVLSSLRLPDMLGLDLLHALRRHGSLLPMILLSNSPTVPVTVQVMRAGAFALLEKPCPNDHLIDTIRAAFDAERRTRQTRQSYQQIKTRIAALDPRERRVLELLAMGGSNKMIARHLAVCQRTVDRLRAGLLRALQVGSTAQAAALWAYVQAADPAADPAVAGP